MANFSEERYEWKNDSFKVVKGTNFGKSAISKSIFAEKELGNKVEIKWIFTKWNELKFQGELEDAQIETK